MQIVVLGMPPNVFGWTILSPMHTGIQGLWLWLAIVSTSTNCCLLSSKCQCINIRQYAVHGNVFWDTKPSDLASLDLLDNFLKKIIFCFPKQKDGKTHMTIKKIENSFLFLKIKINIFKEHILVVFNCFYFLFKLYFRK